MRKNIKLHRLDEILIPLDTHMFVLNYCIVGLRIKRCTTQDKVFFSLAVFRITLYMDTKAFKPIFQICLFIAVKILFHVQKDILKEY